MKIGPRLQGKFTRRSRQVNCDSCTSHENQISINTVIHEKGTDGTCWNFLIPWTRSGIYFSRMFTKFLSCPPFWQSQTHTHTHTHTTPHNQPSPERPSNIRPEVIAMPIDWGTHHYSGEKFWPWQRGWGSLSLGETSRVNM